MTIRSISNAWLLSALIVSATTLPTLAAGAEKPETEVSFDAGLPDATKTIRRVAGDGVGFTDCGDDMPCPSMVVVPASKPGDKVGSPEDEPLRLKTEARHEVELVVFAIGQTEVSVGQYMACVEAGGCRHPEWAEPGGQHNIETGTGVTYKRVAEYLTGSNQPVTAISWHDATAYAAWLAKTTGRPYRLPSETEWEYAARAGRSTPYWWGSKEQRDGKVMACCDGCGSDRDMEGPYPVKSFAANPWGLYQVHGNVWEWVADYFCEDYATSPRNGSARMQSKCPKQFDPEGLKIFRGGSCFYTPRQMRASMRLRNVPELRNMTIGFRVARDLR